MQKEPYILEISVSPEEAASDIFIKQLIASKTKLEDVEFQIVRRSIDARKKQVKFNLKIEIYTNKKPALFQAKNFTPITSNQSAVVIGFGPAGMFAALKLIENNIKPIVIERGKSVRNRRRDLANITKNQIVNPESNYCFGEGGAGTFSDGKLYTRSTKRGDVKEVLQLLVQHGADENILVDAHPHIGTNKLPKVVEAIRNTIIENGGEIHFESKLTDLLIKNNAIKGVEINKETTIETTNVILATGHSARDIFYLLDKKKIKLEAKPFAIGVRVEHPQELIDKIQYHCDVRNEYLPPASYKLVTQVKNRGVFSFCMCPGGIIAPCATAPGEIVTNGWSPSKRNNPFANSGIVVAVEDEDLKPYEQFGALAGLKLQENIERKAFVAGKNDVQNNFGQIAPAQRLIDFIDNQISASLPNCSYKPGVISAAVNQLFPKQITERLQQGFRDFGNKMKGYLTRDAIIVAVESRTSSPVKIPRDKETLQHPEIKGLYPCGEGAGYAGGIVSAAIDGQKCAEQINNEITIK
ncbi:MAG: NAD(P)/FAD-dependent oxidoreductase [Flavobacteriales bacterium]|nr:NAD(P)/FAD-dependent oxidoreductase [Flavobacteriales bacterium]MCW8912031.1 NAD(P)/FAD-dependent oxidoreductase [Flavobacteriales bacterium]MCW8936671.1 NAD(P)/FAD-dependent oxidoreductase [Flavobacteriales bacterium]MCW8939570.1 NAD(P)/FAD-dependent oxidoreductase [Flavobacteriales bacterium]MCW8968469.1 NAD(P)/FAD-dependent oxidoreductase [Flavobacteriales bacterium]